MQFLPTTPALPKDHFGEQYQKVVISWKHRPHISDFNDRTLESTLVLPTNFLSFDKFYLFLSISIGAES